LRLRVADGTEPERRPEIAPWVLAGADMTIIGGSLGLAGLVDVSPDEIAAMTSTIANVIRSSGWSRGESAPYR
jgi:hypothetical protein